MRPTDAELVKLLRAPISKKWCDARFAAADALEASSPAGGAPAPTGEPSPEQVERAAETLYDLLHDQIDGAMPMCRDVALAVLRAAGVEGR